MSRFHLLLLAVLCSWCNISRAEVTVGSCQASKHAYSTISAAILAVTPGGMIDVCPGTYPEQLDIAKPLTLHGIGVVNLTFPTDGLKPLASTYDTYAQIYIHGAVEQVTLNYLNVLGGGSFRSPYPNDPSLIPGEALCVTGLLENYYGVLSTDTATVIDHADVSAHRESFSSPGTPFFPAGAPDCGIGISLSGKKSIVRHSVVSSFGSYGIVGAAIVEHNVLSGTSSPRTIGISGATEVSDNTVTGGGFDVDFTVGIDGGDIVRGNTVQNWVTGIKGTNVRHNTLINNETAITGAQDVVENLIVGPPSYYNPDCAPANLECTPYGPIPSNPPTIGVNLACSDGTTTHENSLVGVGIGFANVDPKKPIAPSNLVANVGEVSTACGN